MIPQTFIFIGRSGCGKGTQADLLQKYISKEDSEKYPIFYLETGAHFREFIQGDNYSGRLAKVIAAKGDRQPDFLAVWMWSNLIIEDLVENEHLILDGTPRSLPEVKVLDSAMKFYNRVLPIVIYLNVSRAWSETHLMKRGRADDVNLDEIRHRLDWFDRDVIPAIEHLRENDEYRFLEINGEQPIEKVYADIIEQSFGKI